MALKLNLLKPQTNIYIDKTKQLKDELVYVDIEDQRDKSAFLHVHTVSLGPPVNV